MSGGAELPVPDSRGLQDAVVDERSADALRAMLSELQVAVSGFVSSGMHRALAAAAARRDPGLIAIVASLDAVPAGFVVATRDSRRFWRRTLLRHPVLAVRVVLHRLWPAGSASAVGDHAIGGRAEPSIDPTEHLPDAAGAPYGWHDEGPKTVKIVFIGVRPAFRQRGVGDLLYRALFDVATHRGADAVLARIARDNVASIRLHAAAGWHLYRDGDGVFAVRPLAPSRPPTVPA